jgi:hypothetical protein
VNDSNDDDKDDYDDDSGVWLASSAVVILSLLSQRELLIARGAEAIGIAFHR